MQSALHSLLSFVATVSTECSAQHLHSTIMLCQSKCCNGAMGAAGAMCTISERTDTLMHADYPSALSDMISLQSQFEGHSLQEI